MSSKLERLRAELALAEVEEEYAVAKEAYLRATDAHVDEAVDSRPAGQSALEAARLARAAFIDGDDPTLIAYQEAKARLHTQRAEFRLNHRVAPSGPGAATATPAPVEAKVN